MPHWNGHYCRCNEDLYDQATAPTADMLEGLGQSIEPWLAALIQSEHLSLLVGNGLSTAAAFGLGAQPTAMTQVAFGCDLEAKVNAHAERTAKASERGKANIEDQLRAAQALIEGLRISETDEKGSPGAVTQKWIAAYEKALRDLIECVIKTERGINHALVKAGGQDASGLLDFLLSFANRPPTRERLEVFTTNYDRLIEYACDFLGIRLLDRFVGSITPQFRASRVNVDMHFDPPGIRGEPRYLEGVARITKLHGSLDWQLHGQTLTRVAMPFGPPEGFPTLPQCPYQSVMVYPNAAKDVETLAFPYAELFRDFAAALCRPNATLFVYGYSFGDDHINRVLREMLTISSTHLVIVSYNDCDGRLETFARKAGHPDQITYLVGNHFAHLGTLTRRYLPRTLVEAIRQREAGIKDRRASGATTNAPATSSDAKASPVGGIRNDNAS